MTDAIPLYANQREVLVAGYVGLMRNASAIFLNRQDDPGKERHHDWHTHIEGAIKEYCFAKWRNVIWHWNVGGVGGDDCGPYQIRGTDYSNGRLRVDPDDPDDKKFVLITGRAPRYLVRGWLYARDGKSPEFWCDPSGKGRPPSFFVPQSVLNPMDTL